MTGAVLLLGTYRDTEAGPELRELAREAEVISLTGLPEPAVAELMANITGTPPPSDLAH